MSVVVCEDVVRRFGDVTAVDGVSLHVDKGEVFGLIGPNGAGKTTLLNCIEGVDRPTSGSIRVLGRAFVPLTVMPDGVQKAMDFSPVRQFVDLFQGLWEGQAWSTLLLPTGVLIAMIITFGILGTLLFRWERS